MRRSVWLSTLGLAVAWVLIQKILQPSIRHHATVPHDCRTIELDRISIECPDTTRSMEGDDSLLDWLSRLEPQASSNPSRPLPTPTLFCLASTTTSTSPTLFFYVTSFQHPWVHVAYLNRLAYARRHGYRLCVAVGNPDETRHPVWSRLAFVLAAVEGGGWMLMQDADTMIVDLERPLERVVDDALQDHVRYNQPHLDAGERDFVAMHPRGGGRGGDVSMPLLSWPDLILSTDYIIPPDRVAYPGPIDATIPWLFAQNKYINFGAVFFRNSSWLRRWLQHLYNSNAHLIHHGYREQQAVVECIRENCDDIRSHAAIVPWTHFNIKGTHRDMLLGRDGQPPAFALHWAGDAWGKQPSKYYAILADFEELIHASTKHELYHAWELERATSMTPATLLRFTARALCGADETLEQSHIVTAHGSQPAPSRLYLQYGSPVDVETRRIHAADTELVSPFVFSRWKIGTDHWLPRIFSSGYQSMLFVDDENVEVCIPER